MFPLSVPLIGRDAEMSYIESLLTDAPCSAVVVAGAAGVGKSRLAAEVSGAAAESGRSVLRVIATQGAATIPFGAFASLLPDLATIPVHSAELIRHFSRAISERRQGGPPLLLVVDDIQFLDDGSAALIHQLVLSKTCGLLATLRTPDVPRETIVSLWKGDLGQRVEIQALSRLETHDLVATYLGGPVAGSALRWFWEVSQGNPLYVRELLIGARDSDSLYSRDETWFLRLPLPAPARLSDFIGSRLDRLSRNTSEVIDLLAISDALGYMDLARIVDEESLEDAENRGLITLRDDGRRTLVHLSHPLYREVVRQRLPQTRLRRLSAVLVEAIEATGARRREDIMRVARWRLDAGITNNPGLFERAAREARAARDLTLAARFARAALNAGGGLEAGLFLGETEFAAGRQHAAETIFAELALRCRTDQEVALIANARAKNLHALLGDEVAATKVITDALSTMEDPESRRRLLSRQAIIDLFAGRLVPALAITDEVLSSSDPITHRRASYARSFALALIGRTSEAVSTAYEALETLQRSSAEHDTQSGLRDYERPEAQLVGSVVAHLVGGRLAEAEIDARRGYEVGLDLDDREVQGTFDILLGLVMIETGQLADAAQTFREGAAIHREVSDPAARRLCVAGVAMAEAMAGRTTLADPSEVEAASASGAASGAASGSAAASVAASGEEDPPVGRAVALLDPHLVDRSRAWTLIASGELSAARSHLRDSAERAGANSSFGAESILLHDLVRMGEAKAVTVRLTELAAVVDGTFVSTFAHHATARISDDPAELEAVAASFEGMGALLMAAEAAHASARAYRARGQARRAAALNREYVRLISVCGLVRSPLVTADDPVAPLTRREVEVARLAASGLSSRTIAERLHLSVRTVDNHLLNVYSKLGVSNRETLTAALGDIPHGVP